MGASVSTESSNQSEINLISNKMDIESTKTDISDGEVLDGEEILDESESEFHSFEDINKHINEFHINHVDYFYDVLLLIHNLNYVKNQIELKKKLHTFLETYYYKSDDYYFTDYRELFDYSLVNIMFLSDKSKCESIIPYIEDISEYAGHLTVKNSYDGGDKVEMKHYDNMKYELTIFAQKKLMKFLTEHENENIDEDLEIAVRNYAMW